jgi:hypothetical protein
MRQEQAAPGPKACRYRAYRTQNDLRKPYS